MFKCYDYKCSNCNKVFEELTESDSTELVHCPVCNSSEVKRQFPFPQRVTIPGSNLING